MLAVADVRRRLGGAGVAEEAFPQRPHPARRQAWHGWIFSHDEVLARIYHQ
jgi:hypothetical protein